MGSPLLTPPRPLWTPLGPPLLQRQPALRGAWKHLPHVLTPQRCGCKPGQPLWGGVPQACPPLQGPLGTRSSATEALGLPDHSPGTQRLSPGRRLPGSRRRMALPTSQEPAGPKGLLPGPAPRLTLTPQGRAPPAPPAVVPGGCCAVWGLLSSLRSTDGHLLGRGQGISEAAAWVGLTAPDHPAHGVWAAQPVCWLQRGRSPSWSQGLTLEGL